METGNHFCKLLSCLFCVQINTQRRFQIKKRSHISVKEQPSLSLMYARNNKEMFKRHHRISHHIITHQHSHICLIKLINTNGFVWVCVGISAPTHSHLFQSYSHTQSNTCDNSIDKNKTQIFGFISAYRKPALFLHFTGEFAPRPSKFVHFTIYVFFLIDHFLFRLSSDHFRPISCDSPHHATFRRLPIVKRHWLCTNTKPFLRTWHRTLSAGWA